MPSKAFSGFADIGRKLIGIDVEERAGVEQKRKDRELMSIEELEKERQKAEDRKLEIEQINEELLSTNQKIKKDYDTRRKKYNELEEQLAIDEAKLQKDKVNLQLEWGRYQEEKEDSEEKLSKLNRDKRAIESLEEEIQGQKEQLSVLMESLDKKKVVVREEFDDYESAYKERLTSLKDRTCKFIPCASCEKVFEEIPFFSCDPLPVSNWLLSLGLDSFYASNIKSLFRNHQRFIDINSMDQCEVWLQPFYQHSNWEQGEVLSELNAAGFTLGGGFTFKEYFELGAGLGFWHSNIEGRGEKKGASANIEVDTFFMGPYFSWSFGSGYFGTMLWGAWNESDVSRTGCYNGKLQETTNTHDGWNLAGRAEIGYSFELGSIYANPSFIKPFFVFDYLSDFQGAYTEANEEYDIFTVDDRHSNFMSTKAAVEIKKEFHEHGKGFFIPKLTIGWVYMHPISSDSSRVKCYLPPDLNVQDDKKTSDSKSVAHKEILSDHLLFFDGEISLVRRNGFSVSFGLGGSVGGVYTTYRGSIRIECGW